MADAMPLIVSSPGRGLKNESGDFERIAGDDAKKSDGFKCDKNNARYQNYDSSGSLELHQQLVFYVEHLLLSSFPYYI